MATNERMELAPVRLPYPAEAKQYGYTEEVWRVLTEAIFPGAQSAHSVTLALAYCKARNLDVLKRPVHIVPIWDSKRKCYVETIWPGIGELRTTASRTGKYAGKDKTDFGPTITEDFKDGDGVVKVSYPEWGQMTVYKIVEGVRCAFEGPKVYWKESYATKKHDSDVPNTMWKDRPSGQLEKCVEAAALRAAFPEELGNDYAAEEMEGRKFRSFATTAEGHDLGKAPPRRRSEVDKGPEKQQEQTQAPASTSSSSEASEGSGEYLIQKVEPVTYSGNKKYYKLTSASGPTFATWSETEASIASSCASNGTPVQIAWKKSPGKENLAIKSLQPVMGQAAADELPDEPGSNG